jgi:ABC-type lipoprotein release transport system permease subunit
MFGVSKGINLFQSVLAVLVIISIIEVTVYMAARGVWKVRPAVALNRGEQVQETKAVFPMTSHQRLPLSLVLAIKDIFYNKKMFLTLVLFIIATTFTVVTLATTTLSLTSQKENNNLWLGYDIDAKLVSSEALNKTRHQEVLNKLSESDSVLASVTVYTDMNSQIYDDYNEKYLSTISQLFVTDQKEPLNFSVVSGRIPENEQEIMLAQNLLSALQKEIGDYVKVRSLGVEKDLLIVGICQSMTNQGMTFRLFLEELEEEYLDGALIQVKFVEDLTEEDLVREMNGLFGEDMKLVFEYANASMLSMFDVLSLVTTGIIFIFTMISLVVLLNLNITNVNKERFNYGIYKSIGMQDQSIINIYLAKNFMVNIIGLIIGASIALLAIPSIMNAMTSQLGLNDFPTTINYLSIFLALVIVFSVTFVNAFVIKRNISRITPKELLVE